MSYKLFDAELSLAGWFSREQDLAGWFDQEFAAADAGASGTVAVTEGADTLASSGVVLVTGTLAATEGNDTSAISGAANPNITGTVAVTEGADTLASSGALLVTGTVAATEGADSISASGLVTVSGSVAVTEANDIAQSLVSTVTESYTASGGVDATLNASMRRGQAFTASASGALSKVRFPLRNNSATSGSVTATLWAIGTGVVGINARPTSATPLATSTTTLDVTTVGAGYATYEFAFDGTVSLQAGTAYGVTVEAASGNVGTMNVLVDNTTPSHAGNGITFSAGNWTTTNTYDHEFEVELLALQPGATGEVQVASPTGTVAVTEADDTSAISGLVTVASTLAQTEADDSTSAAATVTVSGSAAITEAADTLDASGALAVDIVAEVAVTEGDDALVAAGEATSAIPRNDDVEDVFTDAAWRRHVEYQREKYEKKKRKRKPAPQVAPPVHRPTPPPPPPLVEQVMAGGAAPVIVIPDKGLSAEVPHDDDEAVMAAIASMLIED